MNWKLKKKRIKIEWNGKSRDMILDLVVPKPILSTSILSPNQSNLSVNKGVARDRSLVGIMKNANDNKNEQTSWAMECQNIFEEQEKSCEITTELMMASGILCSLKDVSRRRKLVNGNDLKSSIKPVNVRKEEVWFKQKPVVLLEKYSDFYIK